MNCSQSGCNKESITSRGISISGLDFCEEHQRCAKCNHIFKDCTCASGVTKSYSYITYLKNRSN